MCGSSILSAVSELELNIDEWNKHRQWRRISSLHEQRYTLT